MVPRGRYGVLPVITTITTAAPQKGEKVSTIPLCPTWLSDSVHLAVLQCKRRWSQRNAELDIPVAYLPDGPLGARNYFGLRASHNQRSEGEYWNGEFGNNFGSNLKSSGVWSLVDRYQLLWTFSKTFYNKLLSELSIRTSDTRTLLETLKIFLAWLKLDFSKLLRPALCSSWTDRTLQDLLGNLGTDSLISVFFRLDLCYSGRQWLSARCTLSWFSVGPNLRKLIST